MFIGYDPRQPVAYNVCQHSVVKNSSKPVHITPLIQSQLPVKRQGLTQFTYTRYLVPWLCGYKGQALFMDPDMIVTGDIAELFECGDIATPVCMRKNQQRFEWASVMLFSNPLCERLTPDYIENPENKLFDYAWTAKDGEEPRIGDLPDDWNFCIGYEELNEKAKLWHYTQGIPVWPETDGFVDEPWKQAHAEANSSVSFAELMGPSVHVKHVRERLQAEGKIV